MSDEIWFLDVAGNMGVAQGPPGKIPRLYTVPISKEHDDHEDAFGRATLWIAEQLSLTQPRAVFIEAPRGASVWGNTNADTNMRLIGLWAAIAGVVKARKIHCQRGSVSTIRKFFIGVGNMPGPQAKKEVIRVCRSLGWDVANDNEADAAAGWLWACSLYDKTLAPPRALWMPREG